MGNPEHLMDKHKQAIRNSIRSCKEKADNNPNNKRAVAMLRTLIKEEYTLKNGEVILQSGRQEYLENVFNSVLFD